MKILVTGGTGVIGSGLIPVLLEHGHTVRLLSRQADQDAREFPEGVKAFRADVTDPTSLRGATDECQAVIHITGIVEEKPPEITFENVNVRGTENVLAEAGRSGVTRFVFVSSLGADRGQSDYHRSKLRAEQLVQERWTRTWIIARPGNVYGPGDDVISTLLKMVRSLPAVPVIDSGDQPFQPIWFEDLGRALAETIERADLRNQVLELGGAEITTTRDVLQRFAELTQRKPATLPVPSPIASAAATVLEKLPAVDRAIESAGFTTPISTSKLQMLLEGNVIDPAESNALTNILGIEPTALDEGLRILADDLPESLPDEGVGSMEHKMFWADITGSRFNAQELMQEFRERITEMMPIEFSAEPGAPDRVERGATLTAAIPGRGHIQVRVREITPKRFTFVTVEGHPLAGTVTFEAHEADGVLRFTIEIHARAANIVDWLAMRTIGRFAQAMNWRGVVLRVIDLSGGEASKGVRSCTETLPEEEAKQVTEHIRATV